jgi:streptogramin lyase
MRFAVGANAFAALAFVVALSACGGSVNSVPVAGRAAPTSTPVAAAPVTGTLLIPTGSALASGSRRPKFVVSQTAGVTIAVRAHGSSAILSTLSFDVSTTSAACTPVTVGRSCTLPLSLAPSAAGTSYDLTFLTYDTAPVGGTIPASASMLASGALGSFVVTAGTTNAFAIALSGTPASVTLPATALATTGTPSTVSEIPAVKDSAGNTIIGAYTTAITVAIGDTGAHTRIGLSTGAPGASVVLNSSTDAALVQLTYDGVAPANYTATLTPSGVTTAPPVTVAAIRASAALSAGAAAAGATVTGVAPLAVLTGRSQSVTYTLTEAGFAGTFLANVQTVSGTCPAAPLASGAGTPATFTLTLASAASCTITFSAGSSALPALTVTQSAAPTGTISEFGGGALFPFGITAGPDGNLWYTDPALDVIGRVTTAGTITQFPVAAGSAVQQITAGPDGKMWFTEQVAGNIGRMATDGTGYVEFGSGAFGAPQGITSGPDGNLWFTEFGGAGRIGKMTPSGVATFFGGSALHPREITAGPDGNLWYTEFTGGKIARITLAGVITEFAIPSGIGALPNGITSGPDGNLWFVEQGNGKIGKITPAGVVTEFPGAGGGAYAIVTGSDGNLWFADANNGAIGRITTAGVLTEFPLPITLPATSTPFGIAAGSDGNLWFTDTGAGNVGKIAP